MHSDWFNGIDILQGRWQHGDKVGYCYPSGLEKTLCKWDIYVYVSLLTKGLNNTPKSMERWYEMDLLRWGNGEVLRSSYSIQVLIFNFDVGRVRSWEREGGSGTRKKLVPVRLAVATYK
jgi:hypothetical protein